MIRLKNLLMEETNRDCDYDLGPEFKWPGFDEVHVPPVNYFSDGSGTRTTTQIGADGKKWKTQSFIRMSIPIKMALNSVQVSNFKWTPIGKHTITPTSLPDSGKYYWLRSSKAYSANFGDPNSFQINGAGKDREFYTYVIMVIFDIGNTKDFETRTAILGPRYDKAGNYIETSNTENHTWGKLSFDVKGFNNKGSTFCGTKTIKLNSARSHHGVHVFPEPETRTK